MKVLLLNTYSRLGASSRLRSLQYLPFLAAHGVDVTAMPLFGDEYLAALYSTGKRPGKILLRSFLRRFRALLQSRRFDLLWVEKELFPFLPGGAEHLLALLNMPWVVDFDDAVFHNYDRHSNVFVRRFLGSKIDKVMRRASLVLAGNGYLADRARSAGAEWVEILPTVVDLDRYACGRRARQDVFTIGWIGSPTTTKYLDPILPSLAKVCSAGAARLVLVGASPVDFPGVPTEIRPWSEASEAADIGSFDAGIMPLPETPWARGKCGYKLIQYMACGKPVVASPVGVNRTLVRSGWNGFLADTHEEWFRHLEALRTQPELAMHMGLRGREMVESAYSLQATAPRLLKLLEAAVERRGKS